MQNFDALYHSVYTAANEAIGTDGIPTSLQSEIKCTIIGAVVKDEFKTYYVRDPEAIGFGNDTMRCRVYMEKPIAMFNAITAFMHSPNYAEVKKSFKKLDKSLNKARITLVEHIESEYIHSGARLKYFICPNCGANYQLYVFDDYTKNSRVNVESVSSVIEGKGCWYCSEENAVLPF